MELSRNKLNYNKNLILFVLVEYGKKHKARSTFTLNAKVQNWLSFKDWKSERFLKLQNIKIILGTRAMIREKSRGMNILFDHLLKGCS